MWYIHGSVAEAFGELVSSVVVSVVVEDVSAQKGFARVVHIEHKMALLQHQLSISAAAF